MSFVRRSGRLNPNYNPNQNTNLNRQNNPMFTGYSAQQNQAQYLKEEAEKLYDRQRYYSSSPQPKPELQTSNVEEIKTEPESPQKPSIEKLESETQSSDVLPADTSATTKALNKMEVDKADKKKWKKGGKLPLSVRRKKLNQRLSKILAPKSALILLHELKPGCIYKVQEQQGANPLIFLAQVELDGVLLGTGQGLSKSQAKNTAAEDAIKAIVCKTMTQSQENKKQEGNGGEAMDQDENDDNPENLPWAGLASFAMYKMFCEWQNQGTDFPLARPAAKVKAKAAAKTQNLKKELPPNASDLHPAVLLNIMKPGLIAVEVERESGPKCKVTMGYTIDGKTYTGVGGNKKDAKKEAAKAVISSLYGLAYPS